MTPSFQVLPSFADLLDYPTESLPGRAASLADQLKWQPTIWLDLLEAFTLEVHLLPLGELEEAYTRTFDLNPSCTLELGWHLFGETYKRGSLLANLRESLREHRVPENSALPDFLPTLLRLLPRLEAEDARDLVRDCILPALAKVRGAVGEGAGPYPHLLESLDLLLQEMAPIGAAPNAPTSVPHDCSCGHAPVNGKEAPHAH